MPGAAEPAAEAAAVPAADVAELDAGVPDADPVNELLELHPTAFNEQSYFYGTNIPGKPRRFLLNPLGRPKLLELMEGAVKGGYAGFFPGSDKESDR